MIKRRTPREAPHSSDRPTPAATGDARIPAKPNSVSIFNQIETHLLRKKFLVGHKPSFLYKESNQQAIRQNQDVRNSSERTLSVSYSGSGTAVRPSPVSG